METDRDQFSDGLETDSSPSSEEPFTGASSTDISRYSRYTADTRYVGERPSADDEPALAAPGVDDAGSDEEARDHTPSHGLMSRSDASALDDEPPVDRPAVGPRADRLAAQRRAAEQQAAGVNAASYGVTSARHGAGDEALDIPTASQLPRSPRASASDGDVDDDLRGFDVSVSPTYPESDARLNQTSPYPDAQSNARPWRAQTRSHARPSGGLADARVRGSHAANSGAFSPYQTVDDGRYARPDAYLKQARKAKKRRRRVISIVAACVVVLVLCGVGFAYAMINNINSNLQQNVNQEILDALETQDAGEPFYMLLMGTDGSEERRESEEYAGDNFRTDSMMLLRVDPQIQKVVCISLARDTKMDFGEYGINKLNSAHEIGGTDLAIKTVSKLAGVPISHYAILDFDGFKEVIDLLGGVEVNVQMEIDDDMAGGHLDAGVQTINGDQALILARSRHNYDDIGPGDFYRAANQRMVIAAIAKKVLDSDVSTMIATIEKLSQSVETDMGVMDIVALGNSMRGMNMDTDFYTAMLPTESDYGGGIWWEILDKSAWKKMMARVEQGLPPLEEDVIDPYTGIVMANSGTANTLDDDQASAGAGSVGSSSATHSGTVAVRNGCGVAGVATEAAEPLEDMGFSTDVANANSSDFLVSVVVYENPEDRAEAQDIGNALGISDVVQNEDNYIFDTDFLVVVGQDWVSKSDAG